MQNPIVKGILGTFGGLVAAVLTVMIVEGIGHAIFPPPAGLDITNPEDQARMMEVIPLAAKIAVVIAWMLGALAGAWVAIRIAAQRIPAWVVGALMVAASLWSTRMFPHPTWMVVCAVVLPLLGVLIATELHKRAGRI